MTGKELLNAFTHAHAETVLQPLYGTDGVSPARERYRTLLEGMLNLGVSAGPRDTASGFPWEFPEARGDLRIFTAAGRTELGGNHTDHNRGKVLAASIQMDQAAVAAPRKDKWVFYRSTGYPDVIVDLGSLEPRPEEKGATEALVRGIAAEFERRGVAVKGFTANADSTVLSGSGLSSSAAVEVLLGKIFDSFYNDGKSGALELAQIGQKAENNYFGKPCGLMDQTAAAFGGAVAIDFADKDKPLVQQVEFDVTATGYTLCIVDTHGSHADLTPDYAAIPQEMKAAAAFFGKSVLREVAPQQLIRQLGEMRAALGDRAILRAFHFFDENRRVDDMMDILKSVQALSDTRKKEETFDQFLKMVNESGRSSWEILQNIYSPQRPAEQGLSLALTLTRQFLKDKGACRVHGGGFAGTIQAYIPLLSYTSYRDTMTAVFGPGCVTPLRIRPVGTAELLF
ncbi:MAG: galactokinase [Treponema sp.]|jgi:galactokinase|nr:galactokinase [Treponema sp.]